MERRFRITVDGKPYNVTVEDLTEGPNLLYPQPGSMVVPATTSAAPAPEHAATEPSAAERAAVDPGDVVCTLGGVVDSIPVSVGQAVKQGAEIVIVEAMKMRTPMIAPRAGNVNKILVKVGDAVKPGQVLAAIG